MRSLTITSAFASNHPPNHSQKQLGKQTLPIPQYAPRYRSSSRPITKLSNASRSFFHPQVSANKDHPRNPRFIFSRESISRVNHTLRNSWAPSTLNGYASSVTLFNRYCNQEGIPINLRLPASEFLLCAFAASNAGKLSGKTIRKHISALKAWHHIHDMDWNGNTRLRLVLRGTHNLSPPHSRKPIRPPIDRKMLSDLISNLNLQDPFDTCVAACATTAFWGQCRLGELLGDSRASLDITLLPARSNLRRSRDESSYTLRLPRTKTHHHGDNVVLAHRQSTTNPLRLLQLHLKTSILSGDLPLFSYHTPQGPSMLTKRDFLTRCNTIWVRKGHPRITGHSFRIGGTTELLLAGVPPDIVKAAGRWNSDAFLRYWRCLEKLVPLYTNSSFSRSRKTRYHIRK